MLRPRGKGPLGRAIVANTSTGPPLAIAWIVANGHRRVRYRGDERNRIGLSTRAAVINLKRLLNLGLHHNGNTWNVAPAH